MSSPSSVDPVTRDVLVVEWPAQRHLRAVARSTGHACLLVVARGAAPPDDCGVIEDWIVDGCDPADIGRRRRALSARRAAIGRPRQDLAQPVALPPPVAAAHRELMLHQGRPVSRSTVRAAYLAAGGNASLRAFDAMLRALGITLADHDQQLDRLDGGDLLLSQPVTH